jgi:hypothetical protein
MLVAVAGMAHAQTVAVQPITGLSRKVEMQGLASQVSTLQARVTSATNRLFAIKQCHAEGKYFRTLDNGLEGCRSVVPCMAPDGSLVEPDSAITAYASTTVPYGASCTAETRTCNNGNLSGTYTAMTCTSAAPSACALPWGGSIAHGQSVTAYQVNSVGPGGSCTPYAQTRTCNNGALSGSYAYSSCSVQPSSCALPWGGSVNSGSSATAYGAQSVPYGSSCPAETRTCTGGALSGSYVYGSCTVQDKWAACLTYCQWATMWNWGYCDGSEPGYMCNGPQPGAAYCYYYAAGNAWYCM